MSTEHSLPGTLPCSLPVRGESGAAWYRQTRLRSGWLADCWVVRPANSMKISSRPIFRLRSLVLQQTSMERPTCQTGRCDDADRASIPAKEVQASKQAPRGGGENGRPPGQNGDGGPFRAGRRVVGGRGCVESTWMCPGTWRLAQHHLGPRGDLPKLPSAQRSALRFVQHAPHSPHRHTHTLARYSQLAHVRDAPQPQATAGVPPSGDLFLPATGK